MISSIKYPFHLVSCTQFIFFLTISSVTISQNNFEEGYYITNSGDRIECLIKNSDPKLNPNSFKYKITAEEETKKALLSEVKEFGIGTSTKYIREIINYDNSYFEYNNIISNKEPTFVCKKVFLKILVEGQLSLYKYQEGREKRFYMEKSWW